MVVQIVDDVGDDVVFVKRDREYLETALFSKLPHTTFPTCTYLALLVDTNDTRSKIILGSNKDGFTADSVHINTSAGLEIVEVDEAHLGDQEDNTILMTDLHGNREIVREISREKYFNSLLLEWRVSVDMINFDDLEL